MITQTIFNCKYCAQENCLITNYSSGEIVCTNCGVVHEERIIDEEYESRNVINEDGHNKSRIGGPINIHYEDQLSTGVVLKNKKDNYLTVIRQKVSPIRILFRRAEELGEKLKIPTVIIERSKDILHRILKAKKVRKKLIDHIIIIVFFKKFYDDNIERSLNIMRSQLGLNKEDMQKAYTLIDPFLCENTNILENVKANLDLFCMKITIEPDERILIYQIGESIVKNNILTDTSSGAIAASVMYFYSKLLKRDNVTLASMKNITGIKPDQIKSAFLVLIQHKQIIPKELIERSDNLNMLEVI